MSAQSRILERMARRGLVGTGAHVEATAVFAGLDWQTAGARPAGASHTIYQLLNHMTYWQDWVVQWLDGDDPSTPRHASAGWPGPPAPANRRQWERTVRQFRRGLARLDRHAREADLLAADGKKTPLEMLQTIGAHNSYHAGQVALMRRMLDMWPPPSGGFTW